MNTIRSLHEKWSAKIMPPGAPQVQRQEMERAFFSGAAALFGLTVEEIAALPYEEADKAFEAVHDELVIYFKLLGTIPGTEGTQRQ